MVGLFKSLLESIYTKRLHRTLYFLEILYSLTDKLRFTIANTESVSVLIKNTTATGACVRYPF